MPGGGGANSPPPKVSPHNFKTPGDIEKKRPDFNVTPLTVIIHILSISIVVRCCHSNLLFLCVTSFFGLNKQRNLNYSQDNYVIKLKFGIVGYF